MEEHQVIIAGGGPAGAACATALREEGIEVLVIEKERLPRHKTCSGVLFGQTQLLLNKYFGGLPPENVYCEPKVIKASNIQEWSAEKGFFPYVWEIAKNNELFPQEYYNVWRNVFDYWLLQQSGADYRENCTLRGFSVHDSAVIIDVADHDTGAGQLACSYLIGAEGPNSRVRMTLDPAWSSDTPSLGIYQTYQRFSDLGRLQDGHWYVFFEKELGDILSCVHRKDAFLALCVGGFKGRHLKESMEAFKALLVKQFRVVFDGMARDEGCILRLSPLHLGYGRVLLTGEAAGIIYLNGEGISAALDSGYEAGKAVAHAIKERKDAVEIYRNRSGAILRHLQACRERMHFVVEK